MPDLLWLKTDDVEIGWRARADMGDIESLAKSIENEGQIQPILVRPSEDNKFQLIAGHRRLEACKFLGVEVAACPVDATDGSDEIWLQLLENMQRKDFSPLELGEGLKWHKHVYENELPEKPREETVDDKTVEFEFVKISDEKRRVRNVRYTKWASNELGVSETIINSAIQLATCISPEDKKKLRGIQDLRDRAKAERRALVEYRKKKRIDKFVNSAETLMLHHRDFRIDFGDLKDVLRDYKDEGLVFDAVITDPPYSLERSKIDHVTRSDLNEDIKWDKLDLSWILHIEPLLAEHSNVIAFCPAEWIGLYRRAFEEAGLAYRGFAVWHKTNPAPQHRPGYLYAAEHFVWASKGLPYFKEWENAGTRDAHNVFEGPMCCGNERIHPTQKPESVMDRIIERHVSPTQKVLDPFAGSGTTLACCIKRNIWSAGIEKEKEYYDVARARLDKVQSEKENDKENQKESEAKA